MSLPVRSKPNVRVRAVNHTYGHGEHSKQVLFDNHLDLGAGEIIIMTGPSGSGKTTLLTLIGALRSLQQGSIQVLGRELGELSPRELVEARRDVGFIFQGHNLFQSLTALENVNMAIELVLDNPKERDRRAAEILTKLGLGQRMTHKPDALSGGQKQRVAIARALVNQPKLILADEPTAALDKDSGRDVVNLLKVMAKEQGATIMIVTHDNRILDVADRIVNMVDGRIVSNVLVKEALIICEFLKKVPLFAEHPPAMLTEFAERMTQESYENGQAIFREGDEGDKFYIIADGRVRVLRDDLPAEGIKLETGNFFGEVALLTGDQRNATIQADGPVTLYALGKTEFQRAIDRSKSLEDQLRQAFYQRS